MGEQVLITGGAGFIGCNLADRLLGRGDRVVVFDNLSLDPARNNLEWLLRRHGRGGHLTVVVGDVRDAEALACVLPRADRVYHLAGQVAVSGALQDPREDFAVNAGGTLEVLEAVSARRPSPPLLYTSTSKVYGALPDLRMGLEHGRYQPDDPEVAQRGIPEARPLDFHSPYGCSKGAADQYVTDFGRTFGLPTTVLRMSCIYGPHQIGSEDQGWVAHFVRQLLLGEPITLFGDGRQVRDLLFVDDLIDAMLLLQEHPPEPGAVFNVGGGPDQQVSLLEVLEVLQRLHGGVPPVSLAPWRPGDQRYYVSDVRRLTAATGWSPRVMVEEGLDRLYGWLFGELAEGRLNEPEPTAGLGQRYILGGP